MWLLNTTYTLLPTELDGLAWYCHLLHNFVFSLIHSCLFSVEKTRDSLRSKEEQLPSSQFEATISGTFVSVNLPLPLLILLFCPLSFSSSYPCSFFSHPTILLYTVTDCLSFFSFLLLARCVHDVHSRKMWNPVNTHTHTQSTRVCVTKRFLYCTFLLEFALFFTCPH